MGYADQSLLSNDEDFQQRLAACAASEDAPEPGQQATAWSFLHVWEIAAAPGFADAYASALAGSVDRPGWDPSVISDAQILSAVQALIAPPQPPLP